MSFLDNTGLSYFYGKLKEKFIRSVSAGGDTLTPDATGNVAITNVATADNLTSPDAQTYYADFIYRTSGGSASLSSGEANLVYVDGNMSVSGRIEENFNITSENDINIIYDADTWRSQISTSGTYNFLYVKPTSSNAAVSWTSSGTWSYNNETVDINTYGLTATNIINPSISVNVTGTGVGAATVVPSSFSSQITTDGTYSFNYDGSNWLLDETIVTLSDYGINSTGTAVEGDIITVSFIVGTSSSTVEVIYVAPERGIISIPTPTGFSATGFNQFDTNTMYIQNAAFSNGAIVGNSGTYACYCRAVGDVTNGYVAYSSGGYIIDIGWCSELPAIGKSIDQTTISVSSTLSSVEFANDGYVVVIVSNKSDLCLHPKWSGSADTEYADYVTPSTITFPTVDTSNVTIPIGDYGMPAVGSIADRLNLDAGTYIKRIGRLINTTSNMEYVVSLDTTYDYDNDYIYYVLLSPITYTVNVDPVYIVNDWGTEEFLGTDIALYAQTLYGQNLRDKLRTDVVTISEQNPALEQAQKDQVCTNIGAVNKAGDTMTGELKSIADFKRQNNLLTIGGTLSANTTYGTYYITDKNDVTTGYLTTVGRTNGTTYTRIGAKTKKTNGTNVENALELAVSTAGAYAVSVTSEAAWRTALGIEKETISITVPDEMPTGVSSVENVYCYRTGYNVIFQANVTLDSTAPSTWVNVASGLPAPPVNVYFDAWQTSYTTGKMHLRCRITTAGNFQVNRGTAGYSYNTVFTYIADSL